MAGIGKRTYLREVNPHLICPLCRGYLIDATTVVECLHSFCRSCILKHLNKNAQCPTCKHLLNTAKPNIKADKALQDIVYKLVPGLYHKEMRKRREFYSKHPEHGFAAMSLNHLGGADSATPEQRGEDVSGRLIFAPEDAISLSLEYLPVGADPLTLLSNNSDVDASQVNSPKTKINNGMANRRYLQCPALVTIAHLKKFLALKYSVDVTRYNIDICHRRAPLPEHWTLMDVAYIFAWKRNAPIRFFYRITQEEQQLEAPPNDRPSTPGLGASQPIADEQAIEPKDKEPESNKEPLNKPSVEESKQQAVEPKIPQISPQKPEIKRNESENVRGFLAKRSAPSPKENLPVTTKPLPPLLPKPEPQVKSPIKIMKNSDGRYQVLRGPATPLRTTDSGTISSPKPSPPSLTPAEFSVVSIADGVNSNSVKITLKQCPPGSTTPGSTNSTNASKKPKVISNVLLRSPTQVDKSSPMSIVEQLQEQKQKRKVTFLDNVESSPLTAPKQAKKSTEQADKKQFLQGFRLTAAAAKQQHQEVSNSEQTSSKKKSEQISVEEQVRSIITKNDPNKLLTSANQQATTNNSEETSPTKKRQIEVKINSTNIADRLSDPKQLATTGDNASQAQAISSSNEQQPIDVYAFPNDPPTALPAGAVKRKCPPGLPIFDVRKKPQPYQTGKRAGVNTTRGGGAVKCYRNQSAKPMIYAKPPPSPARPLQSLNAIGNVGNVNAGSPSAHPNNNPTVTSTSPKNPPPPSSVMISNDTRNLLDGCGLNIPASLSITLTAPKSPSRVNDPVIDSRGSKEAQSPLDKVNPSITLNDKSVDPKVLKALKSGQMRMPAANAGAKTKGRQPASLDQTPQQGPAAKRKKEEQLMQQAKNILDLSGTKKMDTHPLKIPTPIGKFKPKPPTWSQANSPKPPTKDDAPSYTTNGQVVTVTGGQRFYRAPPGSLTPAAHRIGDIPTPSRAPVYAPCFSSPSPPTSRPPPVNLSSVFPSLQSLYALSQSPSLEQFHMDSRIRMAAAANAAANANKDSKNVSSNNSGSVGQKSHLAAQCAPIKPARSSIGSFAVPIAKQISGTPAKLPSSNKPGKATASTSVSTAKDSETTTSSTDSGNTEQKDRKVESSKEASSKTNTEQSETCTTSSAAEEGNSQGSASPRVTSTASPSPPPSASEASTSNSSTSESKSSKPENRQQQPSSGSEVTSSNKSPESPDSSSVVTESISNLVDSTKPVMEKAGDASPEKADTKTTSEEKSSDEAKSKEKLDTTEFKKPVSSETLQKRFLDAFPSTEWANDPVAAEQFGNFLKRLSSMQAEAQSKNAKAVD
ncbi:polycomb group protein Psc isoform X1 [Nasonia vitripennis]|uniref:RING-type domain-containing protein n=1 Tax=Nasonia vitripennis TaxID=7425 RepID=A0A7M7H3F9_NASVI|nr:polycomb group protein Psc isoform X1 [Nasonia vitripennis]